MRIVTLTLHPALDRVLNVNELIPGETFDAALELAVPSGKGVNTARGVAQVAKGVSVLAVAWPGVGEIPLYKESLKREGIAVALCARQCRTRQALTILERNGRETHLKEAMPPVSAAEQKEFLAFWKKSLKVGDVVTVCGSAPPGLTKKFLQELFAIARAAKVAAVVVDTNGIALEVAAQAGVAGLKGNAKELGELLKLEGPFNTKSINHLSALSMFMAQKNAPSAIMITLGAAGALVTDGTMIFSAASPQLGPEEFRSATGCGDAATAGWLWALSERAPGAEMIRRAVACGAAKACSADPGALDAKRVERLLKTIQVKTYPLPM